MSQTPPEAGDGTQTSAETLWLFAKLVLILVGASVAAVLVLGSTAALWPESTHWVLLEDRGYKYVLAGASFGICLSLGAAAFVFKYIPVIGAALAFMAQAAFWVALVLFLVAGLPGLLSTPTITGTGGAL